jgi:hypothetical protein
MRVPTCNFVTIIQMDCSPFSYGAKLDPERTRNRDDAIVGMVAAEVTTGYPEQVIKISMRALLRLVI